MKNQIRNKLSATSSGTLLLTIFFYASSCLGQASGKETSKAKGKQSPSSTSTKVTPDETGEATISSSSTRIDFSEAMIDGKMKAPEGFFLKGRNNNSLSTMVPLRSNFRNELRNSQSSVKSHVK
jgi:hypothetical protein